MKINGELNLIKNLLGRLQNLEVIIKEDNQGMNGRRGQLFESFIHNLLIASLFCGTPNTWKELRGGKEKNQISLDAKSGKGDISIHLLQEKNADKVDRFAILNYEYGKIKMDIDSGKMDIGILKNGNNDCNVSIYILDEHKKKEYLIQVDLVDRVIKGECHSKEVDGLFNQLEVIQWLIENKSLFEKADYVD